MQRDATQTLDQIGRVHTPQPARSALEGGGSSTLACLRWTKDENARCGFTPLYLPRGVGWQGFHVFRRGLGTWLYNNGTPIETVAKVLRYGSGSEVTLKYYVEVEEETKAAALQSLPRKIQRVVHAVNVAILRLQQKRRRRLRGDRYLGIQPKMSIGSRRMTDHKLFAALFSIPLRRGERQMSRIDSHCKIRATAFFIGSIDSRIDSPGGHLGSDADEFLAVSRRKAGKHEAAGLDLRSAQFLGYASARRCQLDVHDAPVSGSPPASNEPPLLEAVERRGDRRERRIERPSDLANIPIAWCGENGKQAHIVHVEIGIGAADEQAGFELEPPHNFVYGFVQSHRLPFAHWFGAWIR
jgi:hypothetical protein